MFENPEFGKIRTLTDENGEPLFCAKDVCDILGCKKSQNAVYQLVNPHDALKQGVWVEPISIPILYGPSEDESSYLTSLCDTGNSLKSKKFLEVNTEIELEGSIARFVETVVADVGKTDVVGEIGIEHVVADAAADADTTIKAAEVCILE